MTDEPKDIPALIEAVEAVCPTTKLTYDRWVEQFKPIQNHLVESNIGFEGTGYDVYGPELEYIVELACKDAGRVWTLIQGDEGPNKIVYGYHVVNRLGFFVTAIPCLADEYIEVELD